MRLNVNLKGTLVSIILGFGKDLFAALAPELTPFIQEFFEERASPDGWTRSERLTYAIGVAQRVRHKQVGNKLIDRGFDWALDAFIDWCQDELDEIETAPAEPVDPTNPHPPPAVPQPGEYEYMYSERPEHVAPWKSDDRLWFNQATVPEAMRWMVLPAHQIGYPSWKELAW